MISHTTWWRSLTPSMANVAFPSVHPPTRVLATGPKPVAWWAVSSEDAVNQGVRAGLASRRDPATRYPAQRLPADRSWRPHAVRLSSQVRAHGTGRDRRFLSRLARVPDVRHRRVRRTRAGERRVGRATRWASDALEEAIAGRIADSDPIPTPRAPRAGERDVPVPPGMAAKAALVVAFRESSLTRAELAKLLGLHEKAVRRLMDPRHDAPADRIDAVLRVLGSQIIIETA